MGVYLLTDERNIGTGRLELEFHQYPPLSGFFIELDHRSGDVIVNGLPYDIRFPSGSRQEHTEYARNYLERVCFAIRTHDFEQVSRLIDIPSFVDYYLVQELFKNSDGPLSNFMYINGVGHRRRLHMGPLWDFDISAGICSSLSLGFYDDQVIIMGLFNLWYRNLLEIPEFREAVTIRWNQMRRAEIPQMLWRISSVADNYRSEFERNFTRHPSHNTHGSFTNNVRFLQRWLNSRIEWLDDYFNGRKAFDPVGALVEFHTNQRPLQINFNGTRLSFENSPVILHDRAMIPLAELPFDVTIRNTANIIIIENGSATVMNRIGSPIFSVGSERHDFVVSSVVANGNIYVPLRQLADVFGYTVEWDDRLITISS
jgi:hypothetical protein